MNPPNLIVFRDRQYRIVTRVFPRENLMNIEAERQIMKSKLEGVLDEATTLLRGMPLEELGDVMAMLRGEKKITKTPTSVLAPTSDSNLSMGSIVDSVIAMPCKGSKTSMVRNAIVAEALSRTNGNRSAAARLLQMDRKAYERALRHVEDRIALIDLDGTVADYDKALTEAIVTELRTLGFGLHVLTEGPSSTPAAWGEKLEWCQKHLPDATVTVTGDKSLVYGRVLFDDFPPYFLKWLLVRPRGLVVCLAHPWNEGFAKGGRQEHPNVLRYDGTDILELRRALEKAYERTGGAA